MILSKSKLLIILTSLNGFLLISTLYSSYEYLVYILMIVLSFLSLIFEKLQKINTTQAIFLFLLISIITSLLLSIDFNQSLIPSVFLIFLFFSAFVIAKNIENIQYFENFILFTLYGFLIFNFRNFLEGSSDIRFSGVAGQPNALGLVSGTGCILGIGYLYLFPNPRVYAKLIGLIVILSSFYLVIASGSRGAFLSVIVALLYLGLKNIIKNLKYVLIISIALLTVYIVFADKIVQSPIYNRLLVLPSAIGINLSNSNLNSEYNDAADDSRLNIASQALEGFLVHPIWGNGISTFSHYSDFVYTHNSYLEVFFSLGLIGGITYILFLIKSFLIVINKSDSYSIKINKAKNFIIIYFILSGFSIPNFQNKSQIVIYSIILASIAILEKRNRLNII